MVPRGHDARNSRIGETSRVTGFTISPRLSAVKAPRSLPGQREQHVQSDVPLRKRRSDSIAKNTGTNTST
jgi:hypothetical protein